MIYFLILTALTVSIDSFVCGFSLSLSSGKKPLIVLGIATTVFVMCLLTNYGVTFFADKITDKTASLGGLILIGVGIYNLLKKDTVKSTDKFAFKEVLISGFAVGLDGALANLSLSLMGINAFYVPVIIAVTHALMIALGILLSSAKTLKKLGKIECVPPIILILLGAYKLLGLFI